MKEVKRIFFSLLIVISLSVSGVLPTLTPAGSTEDIKVKFEPGLKEALNKIFLHF